MKIKILLAAFVILLGACSGDNEAEQEVNPVPVLGSNDRTESGGANAMGEAVFFQEVPRNHMFRALPDDRIGQINEPSLICIDTSIPCNTETAIEASDADEVS